MNVIDMPCKINLIPDLMFPIPPLPDASLTLGLAAGSNVLTLCLPPQNPALLSYSGLGTTIAGMVTGNKTWLITAYLFLVSVIMLAVPAFAATSAQEQAFVDGFKKPLKARMRRR